VDGENFPPEYRGNLLSGNVMTSRINRNSLIYHGSTIECKEEPDFLSTTDPWFRPVDLQIGPDGALYIADFYNRIIGHYEVPLPHPGRDRTSGRLWRVVYKGDNKDTKPAVKQKDLSKASVEELIAELKNPVLTQRLLAQACLVEKVKANNDNVFELCDLAMHGKDVTQRIHALWALHQLRKNFGCRQELKDGIRFAAEHSSRDLRVHAMKMVEEKPVLLPKVILGDTDGFVNRAAAAALVSKDYLPPQLLDRFAMKISSAERLAFLLVALNNAAEQDSLLKYGIRKAIRDLCVTTESDELPVTELKSADKSELAKIMLAVNTNISAKYLAAYLAETQDPKDQLLPYLTHAARYVEGDGVAKLSKIVQQRWKDDLDLQLQALLAIQQGLAQRGQSAEALMAWGEEIGKQVLASAGTSDVTWENHAIPGMADSESPWVLQPRASGDGNKESLFYSSLVKGEQKTGIYRSQSFALPAKLAFWCAGHIGPPGAKTLDLNYIRLRDAANDELLMEARPPRNDTAQRTEWNLEKFAGRKGYVEIIDGDNGSAYAWLAVGRFSLDALNPNQTAQRQQAVAKLAGELKLQSLRPQLVALLTNPATDSAARSGIGAALVALDPNARLAALARFLEEKTLDAALRNQIAQAIATNDLKTETELFTAALKIVPSRVNTLVAEMLAGDAAGAELLLKLIAGGKASPYLLRSPNIKQKLTALKRDDLLQQAAELTSRLPPANALTDKLIIEKRNEHQKGKWDPELGAKVFEKNCAVCHQIGGKGAVVGPQLDGIGARGLERVLEDVIDPNRNVDIAFRMTTLVTEQGKIINGLVRREEGEQLVLVNSLGKEERIKKQEIEERTPSTLSLMPELFQQRSENAAETMTPEDFQNLMAYLLSQRAKPKGE
jgi:putative heme-binding domain-containing protein